MIDDSDLEEFDFEEDKGIDSDAFSSGRLITVAFGGALVSLAAYYLYHHLDQDKRDKLKRKASGLIAEQIHALTDFATD